MKEGKKRKSFASKMLPKPNGEEANFLVLI